MNEKRQRIIKIISDFIFIFAYVFGIGMIITRFLMLARYDFGNNILNICLFFLWGFSFYNLGRIHESRKAKVFYDTSYKLLKEVEKLLDEISEQ